VPGLPMPPDSSFELVENEPDEDRTQLDQMSGESGVDHTESE
jgi:hypothetical protein